MLADVFHLLKGRLEDTGLFGIIYPLVITKTDGQKEFPAHYIGEGQFEPLEYDISQGMGYFRKTGHSNTSDVTSRNATVSCPEIIYEIRTPFRFVALIPKSKAPCDDEFTEDYFAERLISEITDINLATYLTAISTKFVASGYETESIAVKDAEHLDITDINYNWAYIYIDFVFTIVIAKDCMNPCNTYDYNYG